MKTNSPLVVFVVMCVSLGSASCVNGEGDTQTGQVLKKAAAGTATEIKGCLARVSKGVASGLGDELSAVVQNCLGEAESPFAKRERTHVAVLILANYGYRKIKINQLQDRAVAANQAIVLKSRIERAITELTRIKKVQETIGQSQMPTNFPTYRSAARPEQGEVQLLGVARAAFEPVAWSAKKTFRSYLGAATGGFSGLLRNALNRREIIVAKIKGLRKTITLGHAAILDSRCLLREIDIQSGVSANQLAPVMVSTDLRVPTDCHKKFSTNLAQEVWKEIHEWLEETKKMLDAIAESV